MGVQDKLLQGAEHGSTFPWVMELQNLGCDDVPMPMMRC